MSSPSLEAKLERIRGCETTGPGNQLFNSLFHAYIASLTCSELCEALVQTLGDTGNLHRPLRNRLVKLGGEGACCDEVEHLVFRLLHLSTNTLQRHRVDTILSHTYAFASPQARAAILERWKDRGTRSALDRWLKAIAADKMLFDLNEIIGYWRASSDDAAAKILAYRGDKPTLQRILPELIERCGTGWIVGRAAVNAAPFADECWPQLRSKFPATYAYVCAKPGRRIEDAEAFDLVQLTCRTWPGDEGGLTIWAIGQLGMWDVLERVREVLPELNAEMLASIGIRASDPSPEQA